MAQFRTSADILDLALTNAGEVTNGNSPYETQALDFLNKVNFVLIAGGTIPLGKDTTVEIDEVWPWAKAKTPLVLELQPKYDTGTVALTQGSEVGTFSSGPAASLRGYHIRISGKEEVYKIAEHTAASTSFELDAAYPDDTVSGANFEAIKIDYELIPSFITVNPGNQYFQFQKASGTTLTGTLTQGVYSPASLISHVATVATAAAGGPTITGSYSEVTRKFTLTSNLAGATSFFLVGDGTQCGFSIHKDLGYDDETSSASAASHTSTYVLGGIARLVEPFRVHKGGGDGAIFGLDSESFHRDYPLNSVPEGIPDRFSVVGEQADGILTVRFNKFPTEKTRVEVERVLVPRDLKDTTGSVSLVPRKHVEVLEWATSFFLGFLKNDDKMQVWANLVQGKLKAMISQHRGSLVRTGTNFGQIVSRLDNTSRRRGLFPTEPY